MDRVFNHIDSNCVLTSEPEPESNIDTNLKLKLEKGQEDEIIDQQQGSKVEEGLVMKNITFSYRSRPEIAVLNNLSLTIKPKTITSIVIKIFNFFLCIIFVYNLCVLFFENFYFTNKVGVSGSGKSTLLSIMCGLYPPRITHTDVNNTVCIYL